MSERRHPIDLAYRLLGSPAEAEDAVQETYTRWYALSRQQQDAIENPGAWPTTVAGRICLNLLGGVPPAGLLGAPRIRAAQASTTAAAQRIAVVRDFKQAWKAEKTRRPPGVVVSRRSCREQKPISRRRSSPTMVPRFSRDRP